jgi:hypothetical protein
MRNQMTAEILRPVDGSAVPVLWPFELVEILTNGQQLSPLQLTDSETLWILITSVLL